jgi:hypothetical protein
MKVWTDISREVEFFRVVYNSRIEYYRQLQLVSVCLPVSAR